MLLRTWTSFLTSPKHRRRSRLTICSKTATAPTTPVGLSGVTITYNGSSTPPTNAGSYAVVASLTNSDYSAPEATGTLTIAKASATISLSNLSHVYDGTAKNAIASTNPAGLSGITITYNGSATLPTNAGSYAVVASLTNSNYSAPDATGSLSVAKASQTITFDQPASRTYGDAPFTIDASSSSGLPITFSIVSGRATISGNVVTLTGPGTVIVRASQSGDTNYNAAADVSRAFSVQPRPNDVVISQIYGGGGNSGSTYRNDYVELFNRGTTTLDLNGWTIQYASATGGSWQITYLQGSLAPGRYYLIQQAQGASGTQALPAPDAIGSVEMNATSGKVALLNGKGCLNVNPGGWDCEWDNTRVMDLVGYGSEATTYEGDGPTVSSSNTSGVLRGGNGCIDLNDNRSDFDSGSPTPRNTIAAASTCATANSSNSIVISEFRTRGPNGGNDEFIELYNKSNSAIDIGGWKIKGSSNTASVSTRVTVAANTNLPAHGHFLVTNSASGGYGGPKVGDQTYTVGIVDNGGIAVTRADDTIVDQVGMSSGSAFKEGRVLTSFTINTDRSYERKPGGTSGSGQDTDDNRSDFLIRTPPDAQNSGDVPSPETAGVKIIHIDVGQGDATLIIGPSKSLLFDAGPTGSGAQIQSILNSNNLTSVDYFVAGHYHEDHIGGIDEVVYSGVPINVASYDRAGAYSSQAFTQYVNAVGTKRTTINLNQQIDLGGGCVVTCVAVDGRTLHGGISPTDENARSIALVVRFGTFDYFIASDLTGGGLGTVDVESLIASDAGDVDVMRVSHHGSQTSTNQPLVDTLHPEQAVISVGNGNSYGHPTQAVLDRLSAATNINTIWQTELGAGGTSGKVKVGGNIVFLTNGFAYSVSTSVDTQTYGFPTDGVAGISSVGPRGFLGGQYFAAVRWPVLLNGNQSTNVLTQLLGYDSSRCCQAYRN
jgi:beta-lactamase superfamily II metal-dependent hydrolase